MQARRDSAAASDDLHEILGRAENALVIHWRGFMKTAADVLNEQQGGAATIAPAAARIAFPRAANSDSAAQPLRAMDSAGDPFIVKVYPVSYTHLTLPTKA